MTKRQLIDEIRHHNQTAQPQFLAQFDEEALRQYLANLEATRVKRQGIQAFIKYRQAKQLKLVS